MLRCPASAINGLIGEHRLLMAKQGGSQHREVLRDDDLTTACNTVDDFIDTAKLDEVERAAHDLFARFPGCARWYDRLGMVEARGDHQKDADCYQRSCPPKWCSSVEQSRPHARP